MPTIQNVKLPQSTMEALKDRAKQDASCSNRGKPVVSKQIHEVMHTVIQKPELIADAILHKIHSPCREKTPNKATSFVVADETTLQRFKDLAASLDYSFDSLLKLMIEDKVFH